MGVGNEVADVTTVGANKVSGIVGKFTEFINHAISSILEMHSFYKITILLVVLFTMYCVFEFNKQVKAKKEQIDREMAYRGIEKDLNT